MMDYYLKDYLITQKNVINLTSIGFNIYSSFDIVFLKSLIKKINIIFSQETNKIAIVYYSIDANNYIIGILNLPFGNDVTLQIEQLNNNITYKNYPIKIFIEPPVKYSYIEISEQHKIGLIPIHSFRAEK